MWVTGRPNGAAHPLGATRSPETAPLDTGDGRRRSRRSVSNGHQATLIFDNCVSTSVRCSH